jgi:hypothetical protein
MIEQVCGSLFDHCYIGWEFERWVGMLRGDACKLPLMIADLHLGELQSVGGRYDDDALALLDLTAINGLKAQFVAYL